MAVCVRLRQQNCCGVIGTSIWKEKKLWLQEGGVCQKAPNQAWDARVS